MNMLRQTPNGNEKPMAVPATGNVRVEIAEILHNNGDESGSRANLKKRISDCKKCGYVTPEIAMDILGDIKANAANIQTPNDKDAYLSYIKYVTDLCGKTFLRRNDEGKLEWNPDNKEGISKNKAQKVLDVLFSSNGALRAVQSVKVAKSPATPQLQSRKGKKGHKKIGRISKLSKKDKSQPKKSKPKLNSLTKAKKGPAKSLKKPKKGISLQAAYSALFEQDALDPDVNKEIADITDRVRKAATEEDAREILMDFTVKMRKSRKNMRQDIMEADKLLEHALRLSGYKGKGLADMLKGLNRVDSAVSLHIKRILIAHNIRNRIAHLVGYDINEKRYSAIMHSFKAVLNALGIK